MIFIIIWRQLELQKRSVDAKGKKADLVSRLKAAIAKSTVHVVPTTSRSGNSLNSDSLKSPESVQSPPLSPPFPSAGASAPAPTWTPQAEKEEKLNQALNFVDEVVKEESPSAPSATSSNLSMGSDGLIATTSYALLGALKRI